MAKSTKTARKHASKSSPIALPEPRQTQTKLNLPVLVSRPALAAAPSTVQAAQSLVGSPSADRVQGDTSSQLHAAARQLFGNLASTLEGGGSAASASGEVLPATPHDHGAEAPGAADPFSAAAAAAMGAKFPSMSSRLQDAIKTHLAAFPEDAAFFPHDQHERPSDSRQGVPPPDDATLIGRTVTLSFTTTTSCRPAESQDTDTDDAGDVAPADTTTLSVQFSLSRGSATGPEGTSPSPSWASSE
ncbi:hypothetical protein AURDEDRAFT_178790 [Auricularia subglabra TFB-10046 SS5]|uniref:Uncharacterized protein n=1 Tax=Auricularia subglabra (strain TFB-10046 / SS5) TaxID=717982 RepID=J0WIS3_AURST|nr:hypothetical protein AURDEDRAFT_178790 [Auricularia subglabra TFB-10046 SS5]